MGCSGDDRHQEIVLKILYNLSYDDEIKTQFVDYIGLVSVVKEIDQQLGISRFKPTLKFSLLL